MTRAALLKTLLNLFGLFAAAYGTAIAAGQPPKVAAGVALLATVTGQVGLHQTAPAQS